MTMSVPHRDARFEEWINKINRACGRFCAATLGDHFSGDVQECRTHALRMSVVDIRQTRLYRTVREVAQSDDGHYFTVFQLGGQAVMEQGNHRAVMQPGDVTLIDAARPSNFIFSTGSRQISLLLPRRCLEQTPGNGTPVCALRLPAEMSVVKLGRQLITESLRNPGLSRPESEAVLEAVASLLRPAVMNHCDGENLHDRAFRRAVELIDKHIQADTLSPAWVAGEIGVSLRGLYRMFARQGLVVAQYIRNRRLDLCAQSLRTSSGRQKMSTVGYAWGFIDYSHFSRAFKTRFGVSPSEYRKQYG
ncbi:transcriptional regulator FeaR [Enterobacillus tribolii]|uniref:AraC family transcriptional regulator n=1 Tax=Enterobacillus tribolii TaxID=1487935 RepID=A0A370QU96_9GAMM|nr:transcriptional regulator FeaR [Enterobacillus tribolii]MBW7981110.1 transcriptional regulator FeaR [Enterobacillus tribolii]RDK92832.1 AraC family transcriptional regulator [Enterobacillus tribolii]